MRAKILLNQTVQLSGNDPSNREIRVLTPWLPCTGECDSSIDVTTQWRGMSGMTAQLAVQYAAVTPDNPDDWTQLTTTANSTDDTVDFNAAVSVSGSSKYLYRLGIGYAATSDVNSTGTLRVTVSTNVDGGQLTARSLTLNPQTTSDHIVVLTGWYPAQEVASIKAAYFATGASNIEYEIVYRTMNDPTAPGSWAAWNNTGTERVPGGGNDQFNTGEVDPTTALGTGVQFVQFGLAYRTTSGAGGHAELSVALAVKEN